MLGKIEKYGRAPYLAVMVHGGPGGAGSLAAAAKEMGNICGTLEPWQTKASIDELVNELAGQIIISAPGPVTLIGHSWGAWLCAIFTARRPELVERVVLVGCPPLEECYVPRIMAQRKSRLSDSDQTLLFELLWELENGPPDLAGLKMNRLNELLENADGYSQMKPSSEVAKPFFDRRLFNEVWRQAANFRLCGRLLKIFQKISKPLFIIHGQEDPHPWEGVIEPLSALEVPFKKFILKKCGHSPFYEKFAKQEFYKIVEKIIRS